METKRTAVFVVCLLASCSAFRLTDLNPSKDIDEIIQKSIDLMLKPFQILGKSDGWSDVRLSPNIIVTSSNFLPAKIPSVSLIIFNYVSRMKVSSNFIYKWRLFSDRKLAEANVSNGEKLCLVPLHNQTRYRAYKESSLYLWYPTSVSLWLHCTLSGIRFWAWCLNLRHLLPTCSG